MSFVLCHAFPSRYEYSKKFKKKNTKKKRVSYLPTLLFSECNLNHTYFFIWPKTIFFNIETNVEANWLENNDNFISKKSLSEFVCCSPVALPSCCLRELRMNKVVKCSAAISLFLAWSCARRLRLTQGTTQAIHITIIAGITIGQHTIIAMYFLQYNSDNMIRRTRAKHYIYKQWINVNGIPIIWNSIEYSCDNVIRLTCASIYAKSVVTIRGIPIDPVCVFFYFESTNTPSKSHV